MSVHRRHQIILPMPVAEAFPLFTPKGEELWVPGWNPVYIFPPNGEAMREMLFTTRSGAETSIWTCLEWEPAMWHVRYQRTTVGSRIAYVDIRCRHHGIAETVVTVSYTYHALSEAGHAFIGRMSQDEFERMIHQWGRLIEQHRLGMGANRQFVAVPPHASVEFVEAPPRRSEPSEAADPRPAKPARRRKISK